MGLYLDKTGLGRLWAKCKSTFQPKRNSKNITRNSSSGGVWYIQILNIKHVYTWTHFAAKIYVEDLENGSIYAEYFIQGRPQSSLDNVAVSMRQLSGYGNCQLLAKHNSSTHTTEIYLRVSGAYISPKITLDTTSSNISFSSGTWTQNAPTTTWEATPSLPTGTFSVTLNAGETYTQLSVDIGKKMPNYSYKVFITQDGNDVPICGAKVISKFDDRFIVIVQPLENIGSTRTIQFDFLVIG